MRCTLLLMVTTFLLTACATKKMPDVPKLNIDGTHKGAFIEAVKQPIYSANLIKKEIPENLQNLTVVYEAPANCAEYVEELALLNEVLGEDFIDKSSDESDTFTLNLGQMLSDEIEANIPFNSMIKRLSGARKHEKKRLSAKVRGQARRSYLNGWADGMQCHKNFENISTKTP